MNSTTLKRASVLLLLFVPLIGCGSHPEPVPETLTLVSLDAEGREQRREVALDDDFLEEIGLDWRGLERASD